MAVFEFDSSIRIALFANAFEELLPSMTAYPTAN